MSEPENYDYLDKYVNGYGMLDESELWTYLKKTHPKANRKVDELVESINHDPKGAMALCLEILQDVNLENVAKDVIKIFDKENKKL